MALATGGGRRLMPPPPAMPPSEVEGSSCQQDISDNTATVLATSDSCYDAAQQSNECGLEIGSKVNAFFYTEWHPATIRGFFGDEIEVLWDSEWSVSRLPAACIKLSSPPAAPVLAAVATIAQAPATAMHPAFVSEEIVVPDLAKAKQEDGTAADKLPEKIPKVTENIDADTARRLCAFVKRWGLHSNSHKFLLGLPATVLDVVVDGFQPPALTASRTYDALIHCYACSVAERGGNPEYSSGEVSTAISQSKLRPEQLRLFAQRWSLDVSSSHLLEKLPVQVQRSLMAQFHPAGEITDLNEYFRNSARRMSKKLGHPLDSQSVHQLPTPLAGCQASRPARRPVTSTEWARQNAAAQEAGGVRAFVRRHGLDESTEQYLERLPEEVRSVVLDGFKPRSETRSTDALLRGYVASIQASLDKAVDQRPVSLPKPVPSLPASAIPEAHKTPEARMADGSTGALRAPKEALRVAKKKAPVAASKRAANFGFDLLRQDESDSESSSSTADNGDDPEDGDTSEGATRTSCSDRVPPPPEPCAGTAASNLETRLLKSNQHHTNAASGTKVATQLKAPTEKASQDLKKTVLGDKKQEDNIKAVGDASLWEVTLTPGAPGVVGDPSTGIVLTVKPGGQADKAGLRPGSIITKVNGVEYNAHLLRSALTGAEPYTLTVQAGKELPEEVDDEGEEVDADELARRRAMLQACPRVGRARRSVPLRRCCGPRCECCGGTMPGRF